MGQKIAGQHKPLRSYSAFRIVTVEVLLVVLAGGYRDGDAHGGHDVGDDLAGFREVVLPPAVTCSGYSDPRTCRRQQATGHPDTVWTS